MFQLLLKGFAPDLMLNLLDRMKLTEEEGTELLTLAKNNDKDMFYKRGKEISGYIDLDDLKEFGLA